MPCLTCASETGELVWARTVVSCRNRELMITIIITIIMIIIVIIVVVIIIILIMILAL